MTTWASLRDFTIGLFKRGFWLVPALVLDPFDFIERFTSTPTTPLAKPKAGPTPLPSKIQSGAPQESLPPLTRYLSLPWSF